MKLNEDAVVLTRPRATEIIVFMMSDLDRYYKPEIPHAIPVAIGMTGYSLNISGSQNYSP